MPPERTLSLPIDEILDPGLPPAPAGERIGTSRAGRPLFGHRYGRGPLHLSLIAGCHADEPVGPAMLDRLLAWLAGLPADAPLLRRLTVYGVPHANPDGEAANAPWTAEVRELGTREGRALHGYDLGAYLRGAVREAPGDDVEFGFPRGGGDLGARPENRAIAAFLAGGAPFALHASFHGMAFAAGPWFLIERSWAGRTRELRERLRAAVHRLGYGLHDVDRGGEKGFHRIDEGFTSRPDSRAMIAHFQALGDSETAALFRPSSMEYVRSLGGDPFTLVSEMPLFLLPAEHFRGAEQVRPAAVSRLRGLAHQDGGGLRRAAREAGVRPMPIEDQMRLQLAFLDQALGAVVRSAETAKET